MNKEEYIELLEDGELFNYINNLQQRIDKAIFYMENYISVEEYNEPVKCEFKVIIRKLKGGKE